MAHGNSSSSYGTNAADLHSVGIDDAAHFHAAGGVVAAGDDDLGIVAGADDYIEKPFSPSVLVARIKANLAQYERLKPAEKKNESVVSAGPFVMDSDARTAFIGGRELSLKNKEFELLLFLLRHPNQVFSREDLYEMIWGLESMGDNITVAVHVNRLREKIEKDPSNTEYIQTVWGVGYRLKIV